MSQMHRSMHSGERLALPSKLSQLGNSALRVLDSASAALVSRSSTEPSTLTKHGMPSLATMLTLRIHTTIANMQQKCASIAVPVRPAQRTRCNDRSSFASPRPALAIGCWACCHPGQHALTRDCREVKGHAAILNKGTLQYLLCEYAS